MGLIIGRDNVYETYANVSYDVNGWYYGDAVSYKWSFNTWASSNSSGSIRVNLNQNAV